mgnify:FL=1
MSTFAIVRASVPRVARIRRAAMQARLDVQCGSMLAAQLMPGKRNARDALRKAISYRLRPVSTVLIDGVEYRIIAAEAKDNKAFVIDFHAQQRGKRVDYVAIGSLIYSERNGVTWEFGAGVHKFPMFPGSIIPQANKEVLTFGQVTLFDSDLRRIMDGYLEAKILKLWPGVYVALQAAERQAVLEAKALMTGLDEGDVTLSLLNLEDTKANREALASELAQEFIRAFEDLEARAGKPGPNVEGLQAELESLAHRKLTAEALLGVEIPCSEPFCNAELAVSDLFVGPEG